LEKNFLNNTNLNPFLIKDKNILITGASSGIGKKCAITCNNLGANVILIDMDEKGLMQTYTELKTGNNLFFVQDITNFVKLEEIIMTSVQKLGKISGFIHSAGIEISYPLKNLNAEHYEKIYSINTISAFEISRILSKKKYIVEVNASFVYIASIMGIVSDLALTAYSSSKGALISGSKAIALELAKKKIRVNCISPGHIQTPLLDNSVSSNLNSNDIRYPLGLGNTDDIALGAVYLLSEASKWITGHNLVIDGGYTIR
jgi:NAD(P)-dependent dehydrogenase (short-subunit alcohol dehydrogenase family)